MIPLSQRIAEAMTSEGIELPDQVKIAPTHTIADTLNITHDSIDAGKVTPKSDAFFLMIKVCNINQTEVQVPAGSCQTVLSLKRVNNAAKSKNCWAKSQKGK